jgi:putative NIF3 family GTP cyclohydrolase 1 type 2
MLIKTGNLNLDRRKFMSTFASMVGTSIVVGIPATVQAQEAQRKITIKEVIDTILKEIPNAPFERTVDQLRSGNMDQQVTGIVTTMFPTLDVIDETVKIGSNLIVAHETPFYNNQDETDWLQNDDAYKYKIELLNKHKIAIWRFHDYWHSHKPDGIIMGNLIKLGWEQYYDADNQRILKLPTPASLRSIVKLIKEKLVIPSVRVVGDLNQNCSSVYMAFGYMDSKRQIAAIQEFKPDVIVSG